MEVTTSGHTHHTTLQYQPGPSLQIYWHCKISLYTIFFLSTFLFQQDLVGCSVFCFVFCFHMVIFLSGFSFSEPDNELRRTNTRPRQQTQYFLSTFLSPTNPGYVSIAILFDVCYSDTRLQTALPGQAHLHLSSALMEMTCEPSPVVGLKKSRRGQTGCYEFFRLLTQK